MMNILQQTRHLAENDLVFIISMMNRLLHCTNELEFHALILDFARFLKFEFALYAYMKSSYDNRQSTYIVNLSNPALWDTEYRENDYLQFDPVRIELERRLAARHADEFILWDAYDRELSVEEHRVIERRRYFGLNHGGSVFNNSAGKDAVLLLSLADSQTVVNNRHKAFCRLLISHFNVCRKRLDLLSVVSTLSKREKATADLLMDGKTNWEISQIMNISERTVKFHIANIFQKLGVPNRQRALSILLAAQYLS